MEFYLEEIEGVDFNFNYVGMQAWTCRTTNVAHAYNIYCLQFQIIQGPNRFVVDKYFNLTIS